MYDAFRSYYLQDNRKFFLENKNSVEMFGLQFRPSFNSNAQLSCYSATHRRIRIKIKRSKIEFSGSIHTSSKNHNAGLFNFSDLTLLLRQLKMKFGDIFMESKITNLEYGLLVETDVVTWMKYKNVFPDKMKDKASGKVYGQKLSLNDFEIKRYDKLLQMTLMDTQNISIAEEGFRLEIKIKRMRSIQKAKIPVGIYKIEDLKSKANLKDMHRHLHSVLNIISKESNLIHEKLRNDINMLYTYGVMNCEMTNRILKEVKKYRHKHYQSKLRLFLNDAMKTYNTELNAKLDHHLKLVLS